MNRSTLSLALFACAFVLGTGVSMARTADPTPIPRDALPDFSSMQFLVGTWDCSVDSSRRPKPFATQVTTQLIDGGYWLHERTVTYPVAWNPIRIVNDDYITFDGTRDRWVDLSFDDRGAYEVSESRGWSGATIAWSDVAAPKLHGMSATTPRTVTKQSATSTVDRQSFVETSGRRVLVTTSCRKRTR